MSIHFFAALSSVKIRCTGPAPSVFRITESFEKVNVDDEYMSCAQARPRQVETEREDTEGGEGWSNRVFSSETGFLKRAESRRTVDAARFGEIVTTAV